MIKILFPLASLALAVPAFAEGPPSKYVMQALSPAEGRIARPESWFYRENHQPWTQMWAISREEITDDNGADIPFTTGVIIQALIAVEASGGKSAKQVVLDYVNGKKQTVKVIRSCKEKVVGQFTYTCLETEEDSRHVLYSLYWGNNGLDVAIFSTALTTKDLWASYATTFEKMSEFEIRYPTSSK